MSNKEQKIISLAEKLKDKDFKMQVKASKLVLPVHISFLDQKHIQWCAIVHARNTGLISSAQTTSYKQSVKKHSKDGTAFYKLYDNVSTSPILDLSYHIRLGDMQDFFKEDNKDGSNRGIFNTKAVLIQSFKVFATSLIDRDGGLHESIEYYFKYVPYIRAIFNNIELVPTSGDFYKFQMIALKQCLIELENRLEF